MEKWKEINGYEGRYEVSSTGQVRSLRGSIGYKPGHFMSPNLGKWGYFYVNLYRGDGLPKTYKIHRLVALAFVPNPYDKPEVNHKDGNKQNNNVENLEWMTESENVRHAFAIGLKKGLRGTKNGQAKLTDDDIPKIFELRSRGWTHQKIADKIGVCRAHIGLILSKKTWKWKHDYSPTASPKPTFPGTPSAASERAEASVL